MAVRWDQSTVPSDQDIVLGLADELPVGLWVARAPNGELVYANRMFGEIMGMDAHGGVTVGGYAEPYGICTRAGTPYPEHRMPFVRALEEKQIVVVDDLRIHRRDRTFVDVRAFARPAIASSGEITHVVIAFFDITREVQAEQGRAETERRLHHAQRLEAIGTLAGGIAHDFNNLIFGIKLIASELAASEANSKKRASLELIDEITERAATLTRSLLGFARHGKHRAVAVGLDDILESMRAMFVRTLSGIDIRIEPGASDRGSVVGDLSQLEQIVMNLVFNARDAVGDGGHIVVRTRDAGSEAIVLEVADDGPGIPAELRDRVFEPYFTTKLKGADRGTGLGLATVFGIVESHDGAIEIDTGLDGRGATLRVTLPRANRPAKPGAVSHPGPASTGHGTVMVVDDDPIVRRALAVVLEGLGYDPVEVAGGAEAVEVARARQDIRVVLLDMVMPAMGGRATYLALRAIAPQLPVLLMSGYTHNEDIQAVVDLGASGFVSKPYSIEVLAQALAAVTR